jgi:hypothetical protein
MVNSHLFFFGFLNDSLSLEMGFCPPSKSVHPKLELFKVKATSLGLRCHELFLGLVWGKGIHSFLLLLIVFIYFYFGFGGVLSFSPSFIFDSGY